MSVSPEEESRITGDPTQRLLTALGRFQRQVSRAQGGADESVWCDECMSQIITGIEISISQDWVDVKAALTDTARILQTYETAGRGIECIAFLQDSYEILCLMVGDLIVDNVRSGVMQKWTERYNLALEELAKNGMALVADDHESEDVVSQGTASAEETVVEAVQTESEEEAALFDLPGGPVAESTDTAEAAPFGFDDNAPASAVTEEPQTIEAVSEDIIEEVAAETVSETEVEEEPASDAFEEPPPEEVFAEIGEDAATDDQVEPATSTEPEEVAEAPAAETDGMATEVAEAEGTPVEAGAESVSVQALLRPAEEAMARGDLADAKALALELAAKVARLEAEQTKQRIQTIEEQLEEDVRSIEAAEGEVQQSEEARVAAEATVAECASTCKKRRKELSGLEKKVANTDDAIADLEAQIRELEEKRDADKQRRAEFEAKLEDAVAAEQSARTELESFEETEQAAQDTLEKARQHVDELKQAHAEHERNIESARQELEQRASAVGDIERTIEHVSGAPAGTEEKDELLF